MVKKSIYKHVPPPPGPGRPKGLKNKFTNLKQSFLEAFEELGGTKGLYEWAKKNDRTKAMFYQMIAKMLPSNVGIGGDENAPPILIQIIRAKE